MSEKLRTYSTIVAYFLLFLGIILVAIEFIVIFLPPPFSIESMALGFILICLGGILLRVLRERKKQKPEPERKYITEVKEPKTLYTK